MQTKFPDWWNDLEMPARLRDKILSQFTVTRDGYTRWYKGAPRFVCGKTADPAEVESCWRRKCAKVDAGTGVVVDPKEMTFRHALSSFLEHQKSRVGATKHQISQRTYHNYVTDLNKFGSFIVNGAKVADMQLRDIGPEQFTAFAKTMSSWAPSGFDSIVTRIGSLFHWAIDMEYIDRYRPGPAFRRPDKTEIRDDRIGKEFSLTPEQIAKCYVGANHTLRCWIALGMCGAFNNSDVANLSRDPLILDLDAGIIDYRRRKTGKVRRVIPLPADVVDLLKTYTRPIAADPAHDGFFFLTERGLPYSQTKGVKGNPSCAISRLTAKLMTAVGVKRHGVNFKSFRTSFYNMAPKGGYDIERMIIMGRAQGTIDLDSYFEGVPLDRLKHVVNHVWDQIKNEIQKLSTSRQDAMASESFGTVEQSSGEPASAVPRTEGLPAPRPASTP
jgi:integrase